MCLKITVFTKRVNPRTQWTDQFHYTGGILPVKTCIRYWSVIGVK